jgi:hypothetical protein
LIGFTLYSAKILSSSTALSGISWSVVFYKLYPALEHTEKVRILIGLKTDQSTYAFLQQAKEQQQLLLKLLREPER